MSGTGAAAAGAGSEDEIRLRIETISGQVIHVTASKHETVLNLKNRIFNKQGIPVAEQNLMFLEEELKDFRTLDEYNIIDSCTLRLSVGMKGGPVNTRRTLYLDDKNTIHEMAKMLAAHDISVVLVPHNGAYHVIPVPSERGGDGARASSSGGERRSRHSIAKLMEGHHAGAGGSSSGAGGSSGHQPECRRTEENKATKTKMAALQKQFKKKRSAPDQQLTPLISRQSGCCAANLQHGILSDSMPPAAASPVALVAGASGGAETEHKVVVPRLITSHNIPLNELNHSQALTQYYTTTTAADGGGGGGRGGGAFESSSSYASGVERNLVIYPSAGPSSAGSSSSTRGEAIFVSPYKGLFRCTADTTENASKEDVSSGSGRCSSAAAAPPPADNSPTVVERPQPVGQQGTPGAASSGASGASSGLGGAKGQLLAQATTPPPPHPSQPQQPVDDVTTNKDEAPVERKTEESMAHQPTVTPGEGKDSGSSTPPKKKHPRCGVCNKKTGLASSYTCRCGGNFCATHRYAEAHDCGHDYKTEGRQQLEKSNPLIQAAKLQKI